MHYDSKTYVPTAITKYQPKVLTTESFKQFLHITFCLPEVQVQSLDEPVVHFLTAISQHGSIVQASHNHQIYFPPTF